MSRFVHTSPFSPRKGEKEQLAGSILFNILWLAVQTNHTVQTWIFYEIFFPLLSVRYTFLIILFQLEWNWLSKMILLQVKNTVCWSGRRQQNQLSHNYLWVLSMLTLHPSTLSPKKSSRTPSQWPEILWPLYSTHYSGDKRGSVQLKSTWFVSNITDGKMYKWWAFIFCYTLNSRLKILQKIPWSLGIYFTPAVDVKSPWFMAMLKHYGVQHERTMHRSPVRSLQMKVFRRMKR